MNKEQSLRMKEHLELLSKTLRECGQPLLAARIEEIISGADDGLDVFLRSNELWGGAGSVADQAGIETGPRAECGRKIEFALVQLGKEQLRAGIVNPRTEMWVSAFEKWEKTGI